MHDSRGTASAMRLAFENNLIYDRGIKKNRFYYITQCLGMNVLKGQVQTIYSIWG